MVYLPTLTIEKLSIHVGENIRVRPMDPSGFIISGGQNIVATRNTARVETPRSSRIVSFTLEMDSEGDAENAVLLVPWVEQETSGTLRVAIKKYTKSRLTCHVDRSTFGGLQCHLLG